MIQSSMYVFAQINPSGSNGWQHFLQSDLLLLGRVASIVDEDVNAVNGLFESCPKRPVSLVADKDGSMLAFVCFAGRFDVNTVDVALVAKIGAPHLKAAATINAYFQDV